MDRQDSIAILIMDKNVRRKCIFPKEYTVFFIVDRKYVAYDLFSRNIGWLDDIREDVIWILLINLW